MRLRSASTCSQPNCSAAWALTSLAGSPISTTCRSACKSPSRSWSAARCSCCWSSTSFAATASVIQRWTFSTPNPETDPAKKKRRAAARPWPSRRSRLLPDAHLLDQPQNVVVCDVIQGSQIFLFEAFAQIFRGHKAGFAVRQVAPGLFPELHESRVRQPRNVRGTVDAEFRVDGVRVPRRDAVPHVRKTTLIGLPAQFGSRLKSADELAHRAGIGEHRAYRHAVSPFLSAKS